VHIRPLRRTVAGTLPAHRLPEQVLVYLGVPCEHVRDVVFGGGAAGGGVAESLRFFRVA